MKKVAIIQRIVPHYRLPLYRVMVKELAKHDVELTILYGQESIGSVPKSVESTESWMHKSNNIYFSIFGHEIVYQPFFIKSFRYDLVITEQANRLVLNYLLQFFLRLSGAKLAFWGHGRNFQANNSGSILESVKAKATNYANWFFGYTNNSVDTVTSNGFPVERTTVLENAIDTTSLKVAYDKISIEELQPIRESVGLSSNNIGIYCGGMYSDKKIPFLLDACLAIKSKLPDFEMIFIGTGPQANLIDGFCKKNQWAVSLGEVTGVERVKYFAVSKVFLMPGLVGLAVLDSFAMKTPMVTTDIPIHSPEFAYLSHGENGLVTQFSTETFSEEVVSIFTNHQKYEHLIQGCEIATAKYTIENMALNFVNGIISALEIKPNASPENSGHS